MRLTDSLQFKVTSSIQEYSLSNDNWNNVNLMIEHVKKSVVGAGRLKLAILTPLVERAISSIKAALKEQRLEAENKQKRIDENLEQESKKKRKRESTTKKTNSEYDPPSVRYSDLGGIDNCIQEIRELIEAPLTHPEVYLHLNIDPPRGILLHGPPGCGKTKLAQAVAGEVGVPFIQISAPSIVSGMSGESEKKIRDVFQTVKELAPCILFIDEIDAITPKRETAQREMERRIVAQLLICLDSLSMKETGNKPVIVIGATNRPDSIDAALRRAGRFDREICLGIPDEKSREEILRLLTDKLTLSGDFDFKLLAKKTPGYVGADLNALTSTAGIIAVKRIFGQIARAVKDKEILSEIDLIQNEEIICGNSHDETMKENTSALFDQISETIEDEEQTVKIKEPSQNMSSQMDLVEKVYSIDFVEDKMQIENVETLIDSAVSVGFNPEASQNDEDNLVSESIIMEETILEKETPEISEDSIIEEAIIEKPNQESEKRISIKDTKNCSDIEIFLTTHRTTLSQDELRPLSITMADFDEALGKVQPSSKREGFATVPDVCWDDIGALKEIRDELSMSIVEPIRNPELFARVGIKSANGVLLWGPPGCGKTLLAKAVANESHCNFISVKGPELLNKYVGESERGVRQVFARARASAPCVIFFDELDALCPKRGGGSDSQTSERVVNQLLTEMEGFESRKDVYIIAATNRPDIIDKAILRPGRLDKLLYVPLPNAGERADILSTIIGNRVPIANDVCIRKIAENPSCDRFSGADLSSLVKEAGMNALKRVFSRSSGGHFDKNFKDTIFIEAADFTDAFSRLSPSVSTHDLAKYESLRNNLSK